MLAACFFASPGYSQTPAVENAPTVPGPVDRYCSDWNAALAKAPSSPETYARYLSWISGYLGGLNTAYWSTHGHIDLLNDADGSTLAAWVDQYCASNPRSSMWAAGTLLFEKLGGDAP